MIKPLIYSILGMSIFDCFLFVSGRLLRGEKLIFNQKRWKPSLGLLKKSLKFNQLNTAVHFTSNLSFIFSTKFQLDVGPCGLFPFNDMNGICPMNISSLGPLPIKKADRANASNSGGNQSGTKEMELPINSVICSQLSTWLLWCDC